MQLNHNGPSGYGILAFAESETASPHFIWAANLGQRRQIEALLWRSHGVLVGAFGGWLAGLAVPPATMVLLGGGVRLNERTAKPTAQLLRQAYGLAEPQQRLRSVCQVGQDGRVKIFASIAAAAQASGVSRPRIARCLEALTIRKRGLWI